MTAYDIFFAVLGALSVASGLLAVTTKHVTHSALWLVVSLTTLAGCYLVLGAELVALVQLLVYVGAVVVLVLVALMVTRAPIGRSTDQDTSLVHRASGVVVSAATAALLGTVLIYSWGNSRVSMHTGSITAVASIIFGSWAWAFEFLSLLLLLALVSALALLRLRTPTQDGAGR